MLLQKFSFALGSVCKLEADAKCALQMELLATFFAAVGRHFVVFCDAKSGLRIRIRIML
jgi:hypothetical protein